MWIALGLAACGGGAAPELDQVSAQIGQVGAELTIELRGTDADGDQLTYDYTTNAPDIGDRASMTQAPSGIGLFRWTPNANDIGEWTFDFAVSDGSNQTSITVPVSIRSAIGSATAPVFRRPLGTGTTLDLTTTECVELDVVVEDQDNADVSLTQEEPLIEGAELEQTGGLTATWRWCPSAAQAEADDRYSLVLAADDGDNPQTRKHYLVVLRGTSRPDCPGAAPVIAHTAFDEETVNDLTIPAQISDDLGLKQAPLFYYATTPPGSPADLSAMTQVSMILIDGDMQDGLWAADVPNPVAGGGSGAMADLYYVIVADDDDDEMGNCDHTTESPTYQIEITNPGGIGDTDLCGACSTDIQCGGNGNLCVRVGFELASSCLTACTSSAQCEAGYSCSPTAVTSVDGVSARQCVPDSGTCDAGGVCIDDGYEDNDTRSQALANPALPPDLYEMVSCPAPGNTSDDEDWFRLTPTQEGRIELALLGDEAADLDLGLYDSNGFVINGSTSLDASEQLGECLPAGTYYMRVYSYGTVESSYLVEYVHTPEPCPLCNDDTNEPDDNSDQALAPNFPYAEAGLQICAGDQDWFEVTVGPGESILVELTFTQNFADEDLDIHLYDGFFDLTPCTAEDPSTCDGDNGQSGDSNELALFTPGAGTYYVVVEGYDDSQNDYSIEILVE